MKTLTIFASAFILFTASFTASAQLSEPPVKILPTTQKGIVKVLFASDADQGVEVKFYNEEGLIITDKIKADSYPNGFSKKYDVSKLNPEKLWVEVSSAQMDVTYKLNPSRDGRSIEPFLEKTTYNHLMVVAKN